MATAPRQGKATRPDVPYLDTAAIKDHWLKSNKIFMLDYDGTLNPVQKFPDRAQPNAELIQLLLKFNEKAKAVVCTGRQKEQVDKWFPAEIELFAEHGAYHRKEGVWRREREPLDLTECLAIMEEYKKTSKDIFIDVKSTAIAFLYHLSDFEPTEMVERLKSVVGDAVIVGNRIVDIRSVSKDVPCALLNPALCAGDDVTDEDMFDACTGFAIRVGNAPSKADYRVDSVDDIRKLLQELIEIS